MATLNHNSGSGDNSKLDAILPDYFVGDESSSLKTDVSWQWHLVTLRKELEASSKDKIVDVFMLMYNYQKARDIVVKDMLKTELGFKDH